MGRNIEIFKSSQYTIEFLDEVLKKYSKTNLRNYVINNRLYNERTIYSWRTFGIPNSILCSIQKDVQISCLLGNVKKEDLKHLDEIWDDYKKNGNKLAI